MIANPMDLFYCIAVKNKQSLRFKLLKINILPQKIDNLRIVQTTDKTTVVRLPHMQTTVD